MGSPLIWTQRDGTRVRVRDMTDAHVWNTYRMLVAGALMAAHANALAALAYASGAPDGASMLAESEADALFRATHLDVHQRTRMDQMPWLFTFRAEMKHRGLLKAWNTCTSFPAPRSEGEEALRDLARALARRMSR
jgi:hypothetical protein